VKHPSEVLKKGQKIKAVVLNIDPEQRRIALGLKQLEPDIWQTFVSQTPVGSVVSGKVVRLTQFGAFVELREGIEGLCHVSEMGEEHRQRGKSPLKVGTELPFRVLRVSAEEHKIGLSLKEVEEHVEAPQRGKNDKAEVAAAPQPPTSTTMGEKMAQAIKAAAAVSAAKRGTQAVAQQGQAQAVSNSPVAAAEAAVTSAHASTSGLPDVGVSIQVTEKEDIKSDPVSANPQHPEPEVAPYESVGDSTAISEPAAALSEKTPDKPLAAAPSNGGTSLSVEGVMPPAEAVAPASPVASIESAPSETSSSEETLPAGAQS
jgi:predicted RNA-binding protein with RPS1 domain